MTSAEREYLTLLTPATAAEVESLMLDHEAREREHEMELESLLTYDAMLDELFPGTDPLVDLIYGVRL